MQISKRPLAKQKLATAVNAALTMMYWQIGQRINQAVLKGELAQKGKQVIDYLARQLTQSFGKGWIARLKSLT